MIGPKIGSTSRKVRGRCLIEIIDGQYRLFALDETLGINGDCELSVGLYVDLGVSYPACHTLSNPELVFARIKADGLEEARTRKSKRE